MSMKKNLKYLLLLSLLSFMACNGDEKIDSGMVQQDGEVLQLNVRVGDFAINDVSSIRGGLSGVICGEKKAGVSYCRSAA